MFSELQRPVKQLRFLNMCRAFLHVCQTEMWLKRHTCDAIVASYVCTVAYMCLAAFVTGIMLGDIQSKVVFENKNIYTVNRL